MIKCFDNQVWHVIQINERVHNSHLGASYKAGESKWSLHSGWKSAKEWIMDGSGSSSKKNILSKTWDKRKYRLIGEIKNIWFVWIKYYLQCWFVKCNKIILIMFGEINKRHIIQDHISCVKDLGLHQKARGSPCSFFFLVSKSWSDLNFELFA